MFSTGWVLAFLTVIVALALSSIAFGPAYAASRSIGGGTLGYTCKSTEGGSRYCTCSGGIDSADCERMRKEVCLDDWIDACFSDDNSCQCQWKRTVPGRNLGGKVPVNPVAPMVKQ
jgi:hypothetical protein